MTMGCTATIQSQPISTYAAVERIAKRPVARILKKMPAVARPHTRPKRVQPNPPRTPLRPAGRARVQPEGRPAEAPRAQAEVRPTRDVAGARGRPRRGARGLR